MLTATDFRRSARSPPVWFVRSRRCRLSLGRCTGGFPAAAGNRQVTARPPDISTTSRQSSRVHRRSNPAARKPCSHFSGCTTFSAAGTLAELFRNCVAGITTSRQRKQTNTAAIDSLFHPIQYVSTTGSQLDRSILPWQLHSLATAADHGAFWPPRFGFSLSRSKQLHLQAPALAKTELQPLTA